MSVAERVRQAVDSTLRERQPLLEAMSGGTISIIVKLDAAGCPKQITLRTEETAPFERRPHDRSSS